MAKKLTQEQIDFNNAMAKRAMERAPSPEAVMKTQKLNKLPTSDAPLPRPRPAKTPKGY